MATCRNGPGRAILLALRVPGRLDDEVDVPGLPAGVRPLADVCLVGAGLGEDGCGHAVQQRAELGVLFRRQVSEAQDVAQRLDDEGADAERADAVLDRPVFRLVNDAAGKPCVPAARSQARQPPSYRLGRLCCPHIVYLLSVASRLTSRSRSS